MADSRIRVGIIGVGGIAQGHIDRLGAIDGVEIVGLVDPVESQIDKTVNRTAVVAGAQRFSGHAEFLKKMKPDAVIICTPHTLHYSECVDALDAGAHVLIEKPMVCRIKDAQALLEKIERAGRVVGLAYQRHTQPEFRYIRERILSGEAGPVQFVSAQQQQGWLKGTRGTWRQDPSLSGGGQINDSGSHLVDILLWVTGLTPEAVAAFMDNKGSAVDINSAATIRFQGGAMGTLSVVGDAPRWWEDVTIWCEKGAFYVRNGMPLKIQNETGDFAEPDTSDLPEASNVDLNFIRAIQGKEEIAAPPICGLHTIELTEAAWKSAAAGGELTRVYPAA